MIRRAESDLNRAVTALNRRVTVKHLVLEALAAKGYTVDLAAVPEHERRLRRSTPPSLPRWSLPSARLRPVQLVDRARMIIACFLIGLSSVSAGIGSAVAALERAWSKWVRKGRV